MDNDSLGFMNYQSGELAILPLGGVKGSDTYSARLNTDSTPMGPADSDSTYIEPTVGGYTPHFDPFFGFGLIGNTWFAGGALFQWLMNIPSSTTITVYGWWYKNDSDNIVVCAGNFHPPIVLTPGFRNITVNPVELQTGSCVCPFPPTSFLVEDTFMGADTPLQDHAQNVGPGWNPVHGNWSITANGLVNLDSATITVALTLPSSPPSAATIGFVYDSAHSCDTELLINGDSTGAVATLLGCQFKSTSTQFMFWGNNTPGLIPSVAASPPLPAITSGAHTLTYTREGTTWTVTLDGLYTWVADTSWIAPGRYFGLIAQQGAGKGTPTFTFFGLA